MINDFVNGFKKWKNMVASKRVYHSYVAIEKEIFFRNNDQVKWYVKLVEKLIVHFKVLTKS